MTDSTTPASPAPAADIPPTDREKLLAFDRVCRVLWPAVRHFGLLGAHPEYVEAVVELAGLLGIGAAPQRNIASIEAAARADAVAAVAEWINDSDEIREKFGSKFRGEVAKLVSKIRVDG